MQKGYFVAIEKPEWLDQMQGVLEELNEGVLIADDCDDILFVNSVFEEMTGVPRDEIIGQDSWKGFYNGMDFAALQDLGSRTLRDGRNRAEFFLPRKDGGRLPVIVNTRALEDPDGRQFAIVTFTNISEQKAAEAQLRSANQLLENHQKEIEDLHRETRVHLEVRNLELQRTVEIGNARSQLQEQELSKARVIQEGLLPKRIPQVKGLEVAGAWQPAAVVGGDYFDVLKFSERKIGVCIGDVAGKGFSVALLMANLQASFRAFASEAVSPGTLVGRLNDVICNNTTPDKFVTFCYCTIDTAENRLTYASAGHWPPILFRKSGEAVPLREGGPPLGIFPNRFYEVPGVQLASGDRLVLYTDGLIEAMNSDEKEFGERRLIELGSRNIELSASELLDVIKKEVLSFCSGSLQDDFTLVVVAVE
jgi:PAS domain S-box-containing protein